MTKAIENAQENGEKMDEIVGLAVRVTQKELDKFLSENKELAGENLAEEVENDVAVSGEKIDNLLKEEARVLDEIKNMIEKK